MKALKFEVRSSRERPKQTWNKQVEKEMKKNELVKEVVYDQTKWQGVEKTMTIQNPAKYLNEYYTGSQMR